MGYSSVLRVLVAVFLWSFVGAVSSTTGTAASASASATVYPEAGTYKYAGCYNETTGYKENGGARALSAGGWTMEGQDDMTPDMCLSFCDGMNYAGLEYGRECWCSYSLSTLSKKLDEKKCDMPCAGDGAKFCGGYLSITLYNLTTETESTTKTGGVGQITSSTGLAATFVCAVGAIVLLL